MRWIMTYTGRKIDPCEPDPSQICIEDIAHHLALICRYGGAVRRHYSVAEHSWLISQHAPERLKLHALLHDAGEYITGDMVGPLKNDPTMVGFDDLADAWQEAVFEHFNLDPSPVHKSIIKNLDSRIVLDETRALMPRSEEYPHRYPNLKPLGIAPRALGARWWRFWRQPKRTFLKHFRMYEDLPR